MNVFANMPWLTDRVNVQKVVFTQKGVRMSIGLKVVNNKGSTLVIAEPVRSENRKLKYKTSKFNPVTNEEIFTNLLSGRELKQLIYEIDIKV